MSTFARLNKSTTVRARILALHATRGGLRLLSPHAPELAARWAERLFLSAPRHARPSWERARLASATRGRLAYGDGFLPTWTWTPPDVAANGRTVLLAHGWEGRGSQLVSFVDPLLERGYRVVTFDAPGHGDSPIARASLVDHARAIRLVADEVGPVHAVIAHSIGGAATLLATRAGLEAARFVFLCPPSNPLRFVAAFARLLRLDEGLKQAMVARVEARYGVRFEDLDVRADAERLASPLLVIHDREDPVVAFAEGAGIAERAPRGSLLPVTGLGHRAILRAPALAETAADFVDRPEASSTEPFTASLDGWLFERDRRWARPRLDV